MTSGAGAHLLSVEEIRRGLETTRIGRRIVVLPETDSTNTHALNLAWESGGGSTDGTIVFAEFQSAGRGRLGRQWLSPRGAGLHMTILLIADGAPFSHARLMMISAIAARTGIEKATDVEPIIRWPNDLYVGHRKLCGILIETRLLANQKLAIALGIGVNCLQQAAHFPPELRGKATSLEIESSQPIDRNHVARCILQSLDGLLAPTKKIIASEWRRHSGDIGARVTLTEGGSTWMGQILDVHPATGLLVQLDTGARRHFDPATTSRA